MKQVSNVENIDLYDIDPVKCPMKEDVSFVFTCEKLSFLICYLASSRINNQPVRKFDAKQLKAES